MQLFVSSGFLLLPAVSVKNRQITYKMPKLTETLVSRIPQSKIGTEKYWDNEVKGLVLFVGKRSKSWYYQKDIGGQTRRILIGRYPLISAKVARDTALNFALKWGRGAGKSFQIGVPSLKVAMEDYLARPKLRSEAHRSGLRQQFELHLKDWLRLPLDEISKSMVAERHRKLAKTPSTANHLLKYFRTVWNHARRIHDLPESPTMAIEWYVESPTVKVIEDLRAWRRRIDGLHNPIHKVFYELILFTGLRKSEALTLKWKNVFEEHIHLPMTKNGRSFDLPIIQLHHEVLAPLRGLSREWVFPSPKAPSGHVKGPQRLEWSPHAHRRTFATVAMEAGVLEEVVGRLLNHTPLSITGQRYVQPSLDALRPAMNATCEEIERRISSDHKG